MSGRSREIAVWVLTSFLAMSYAGGAPVMLAGGYASQVSERFGYSVEFIYLIGAIQIVGGLALLVRRLASYSATGLSIVMVGAIWSHISVGNAVLPLLPLTYLVLLMLVGYVRRGEAIGLGPGVGSSP